MIDLYAARLRDRLIEVWNAELALDIAVLDRAGERALEAMRDLELADRRGPMFGIAR